MRHVRQAIIFHASFGLLLTLFPAFALGDSQTDPTPLTEPLPLQAAHLWVTDRGNKREITASATQIVQSQAKSTNSSASVGNLLTDLAASQIPSTTPLGAIAGSVIGMIGHRGDSKPSYHMISALAAQHSAMKLATTSPVFDLNYADTPGIDPDAYMPVLLKLTVTKDNWRLVSACDSSDPAAIPPNAKIVEDRVATASVRTVGRGRALITLQHPLDPGEYGIVLRPIAGVPDDAFQRVLTTVWDFSVPNGTAQQ